ncbi:fungal specific transcription factor domain-containing protein [Aspergillus affinis]|uniref:fungal specific transcription factor domain-containing protein n=1 Tax=Aspergillus affinis TaxID=1070780 RepID=UPI0022FE510D|nr:uncharacterized protein KD926_002327 [Aspergillus affinis]KAI9043948.1 hypothetical protein KD926_002327 [Aspergillus affinis]
MRPRLFAFFPMLFQVTTAKQKPKHSNTLCLLSRPIPTLKDSSVVLTDQWAVAPLTNVDFVIDNIFCPSEETNRRERSDQEPCVFCHNGYDFKFLANLTVIAENVYRTFYTLKATQTIGSDFNASLQAAEPLIQRLEQWHDSLPLHLRTDEPRQTGTLQSSFHSTSGAHLRLASLTLGILLYRAVFRPLSMPSPGTPTSQDIGSMTRFNRLNDSRATGLKLATTAWINRVLSYCEGLTARDQNSLWFSWSHICFATITNFIIFRLLHSRHMMPLTRRWAEILRDQSVSFSQTRFGLLRLDTMFISGFENVFHCGKFLTDVLHENVKNAGPQPT